MLLLLRQQRKLSIFFKRIRRSECFRDALSSSSYSYAAAANDDESFSSSHDSEDDRRLPDLAPARWRFPSDFYSLARSGRRRELNEALFQLVQRQGLGSALMVCRLLRNSSVCGEADDIIWNSLLEIYSCHGTPQDAIVTFHEMINWGIDCSSISSDTISDLYEKIRSHGELVPCSSPVYDILLEHLCRRRRFEEAISFFQENRENRKLHLSVDIFNAMINGSSSNFAMSMISTMIKSGFSPVESTYNHLIMRLVVEGCLMEALSLSVSMKMNGMNNGIATYNSLIYGFCLHGMMSMVWKTVKMMLVNGFPLGYLTYRALMIGYFHRRKIKQGMEIMSRIISRGYKMNIITCNIIFHALREEGQLEELVGFLHEIKSHGPDLDHIAYSTLIHGFSKLGETKKALELFHALMERGIVPSSHNHLSLIIALCCEGQLAEAREHLRRGEKDVVLYNAAIDGHAKAGDKTGALLLLGEMIKSGITPSIITFNTIIHLFCQYRKLPLGQEIKDSMLRHGPSPNTISYTTLLDAYCIDGDVASMIKLFDEMVEREIVPNTITYSVIMKGFCKAGQLGKAAKVLDDMLSKGIKADQIAFNTLIQGFGEAGDVKMAIRVYNEMVKHVEPSAVTYNLLINMLLASKNLAAAENLFDDLMGRGVKLRKFAFTALIQAECVMGSPRRAVLLFEEIARAGFEVLVRDYTAAIRRLCKRRYMRDVKIFMSMMMRDGVYPDRVLFDDIMEALKREGDWESVLVLRGKAVISGLATDWVSRTSCQHPSFDLPQSVIDVNNSNAM